MYSFFMIGVLHMVAFYRPRWIQLISWYCMANFCSRLTISNPYFNFRITWRASKVYSARTVVMWSLALKCGIFECFVNAVSFPNSKVVDCDLPTPVMSSTLQLDSYLVTTMTTIVFDLLIRLMRTAIFPWESTVKVMVSAILHLIQLIPYWPLFNSLSMMTYLRGAIC